MENDLIKRIGMVISQDGSNEKVDQKKIDDIKQYSLEMIAGLESQKLSKQQLNTVKLLSGIKNVHWGKRGELDKIILQVQTEKAKNTHFTHELAEFLKLNSVGYSTIKQESDVNIFEAISEWDVVEAYRRKKVDKEKIADEYKSERESKCHFCHQELDSLITLRKGKGAPVVTGWDCWKNLTRSFYDTSRNETLKEILGGKTPTGSVKSYKEALQKYDNEISEKLYQMVENAMKKASISELNEETLIEDRISQQAIMNSYITFVEHMSKKGDFLKHLIESKNLDERAEVAVYKLLDPALHGTLTRSELIGLWFSYAKTEMVDTQKSTEKIMRNLNSLAGLDRLTENETMRYEEIKEYLQDNKKINLIELAKVFNVKKDIKEVVSEINKEKIGKILGENAPEKLEEIMSTINREYRVMPNKMKTNWKKIYGSYNIGNANMKNFSELYENMTTLCPIDEIEANINTLEVDANKIRYSKTKHDKDAQIGVLDKEYVKVGSDIKEKIEKVRKSFTTLDKNKKIKEELDEEDSLEYSIIEKSKAQKLNTLQCVNELKELSDETKASIAKIKDLYETGIIQSIEKVVDDNNNIEDLINAEYMSPKEAQKIREIASDVSKMTGYVKTTNEKVEKAKSYLSQKILQDNFMNLEVKTLPGEYSLYINKKGIKVIDPRVVNTINFGIENSIELDDEIRKIFQIITDKPKEMIQTYKRYANISSYIEYATYNADRITKAAEQKLKTAMNRFDEFAEIYRTRLDRVNTKQYYNELTTQTMKWIDVALKSENDSSAIENLGYKKTKIEDKNGKQYETYYKRMYMHNIIDLDTELTRIGKIAEENEISVNLSESGKDYRIIEEKTVNQPYTPLRYARRTYYPRRRRW